MDAELWQICGDLIVLQFPGLPGKTGQYQIQKKTAEKPEFCPIPLNGSGLAVGRDHCRHTREFPAGRRQRNNFLRCFAKYMGGVERIEKKGCFKLPEYIKPDFYTGKSFVKAPKRQAAAVTGGQSRP
jgi:hypothetical protein